MRKQLFKIIFASLFVLCFFGCKKTINNDDINNETKGTGYIYTPDANSPYYQMPLGGGSLPPSYDLTSFMPPIRNQDPQYGCVGFCLATLKSFHERLEYGYNYNGDDKIMSPSFIYNQNKDAGSCQKGTNLKKALNFLKTDGVCTEAEFPFDKNNCTNLPNNTIKASAVKNKIREWVQFKIQNNPNVLTEMKNAISQMQPIIAGITIDKEFEKDPLFTWGTFIWKENNTSIIGGHCILLVGYDDAKNAFKLLNSWGKNWKDDGYCWVDYNWFLQKATEAHMTYDEFHTNSGNLEVLGSLDFGNVSLNTTSTKTIQLKNNGSSNINVSAASITSPFSTNWSSGTITANSTVNVTITLNPSLIGYVSRNLTISSNASNNLINVQATGTGVQQNTQTKIISLTGNLAFGNLTLGQTASRILTITNTGNTQLTIASLNMPQGFSSGGFNTIVQAGSSVNVTIYFSPQNAQSYSGNIIIISDATSGSNAIITTGTGVPNGGGTPTVVPAIGTFSNCATVGTNPNCTIFGEGIIKARAISINTSSKQITFEVVKCNGTSFNAGGTAVVSTGLCSGSTYASGTFQAGWTAFQITITDNNMIGTKVYYPYIIQGTQNNIYYNTPNIIITY